MGTLQSVAGIGAVALLLAGQAGVEIRPQALKMVPLAAVRASLSTHGDCAGLAFRKDGPERRLVAVQAAVPPLNFAPRSISVRCRLVLTKGEAPRLAVIIFKEGAGAWSAVAYQPLAPGQLTDVAFSVQAPVECQFSRDDTGQLEWEKVRRIWVGAILDGPAAGRLEIYGIRLSPERAPLPVLRVPLHELHWSMARHRAVRAELEKVAGPDGQPAIRVRFDLPTGRHIWCLPRAQLPYRSMAGYAAIRFRYRAILPVGIQGLLVQIFEGDGSSYFADPPPPPSAQWRTAVIRFADLKFASWSRDENDRLDLGQVQSFSIGLHGTAAPARGGRAQGEIWFCDVELLPAER